MRYISLLFFIFLAGCATTGPPNPGTQLWHEQRLGEIEQAYERGEIAIEDYLNLKNDADRIRAEHRASLRTNRIRPSVIGVIPLGHRH
jgi:hypothetical protein